MINLELGAATTSAGSASPEAIAAAAAPEAIAAAAAPEAIAAAAAPEAKAIGLNRRSRLRTGLALASRRWGECMPFWRLFYHVIWATKGREPLIDEHAAEVVVRAIKAACPEQGVILHAVGVMPDHVHVAASIPPAASIATIVGRWKGSASHLLNHAEHRADRPSFAWQTEYGVLSFAERHLPDVVVYVNDRGASRCSINACGICLNARPKVRSRLSAGFVGSARWL